MNRKKSSFLTKAAPSLIAVLIGLIVGIIIIVITNPQTAGEVIPIFFKGPFTRGLVGFGDLFYHVTPILMTGLSVAFAYQTGLFNIGASGQFILGAFVAVLISAKLESTISPGLLWLPALILAGLAGGILASIVGMLKAYRNVNEVISCIMLNYISMYSVNYFIKKAGIYDQVRNSSVEISTQIPKFGLDSIFKQVAADGTVITRTIAGGGIIIGLIVVVILHIILKKTTFGFELRGVGLNRHAAKYAGISENKSIILSMAISGMLAGLGGAMLYLSGAGNQIAAAEVLAPEGFDGIAISLLGLNEPIGVLLSTILIAYLKMGGQAIQTYGYAPELISMIISIILYISALSILFRNLLNKKNKSTTTNINSEEIEKKIEKSKEVELLNEATGEKGDIK
ncbi:MAG: ABC transporter permease [Tissierellia bacterium]|nr:ABC transporter permease [Tissierellia bacterium]